MADNAQAPLKVEKSEVADDGKQEKGGKSAKGGKGGKGGDKGKQQFNLKTPKVAFMISFTSCMSL